MPAQLWTGAYVVTEVAAATVVSGVICDQMANDSYDKYQDASTRTDATRYHDETQQRANAAKISWGIAGVAAVSAGTMFILAMRADAKAAEAPGMAMVPTGDGVLVRGGSRTRAPRP